MPIEIQTQGTAKKHPQLNPLRKMLRQRTKRLMSALNLTHDPEISLVLCDDATIQALNAQWRDEDKPTDVLSFPLLEPDEDLSSAPALGDIVISLDYAAKTLDSQTHRERVAAELAQPADSLEWGLLEEVEFLFIHGLLHLLGHDHLEPEEEAAMKAEERRLWLHNR
jgi:probable rRNA maturation factor